MSKMIHASSFYENQALCDTFYELNNDTDIINDNMITCPECLDIIRRCSKFRTDDDFQSVYLKEE